MVASPLPTTTDSAFGSYRREDLQKLQTVLESKIVRQRLHDIGLTLGWTISPQGHYVVVTGYDE
jgi:hypothetical protein